MSAPAVHLVEVFASIQGEGAQVGEPCIFVRFGECDLRCAWCDTPESWRRAARCRIEVSAGTGDFDARDNPVPVSEVVAACQALGWGPAQWLSLTGGEPLLQPEAAAALSREARGAGARVHLETHGLAVEGLERMRDAGGVVDHIAMDWKLASDVRRPGAARHGPFDAEHARFLALARTLADTSVKIVLTPRSSDAEIDAAVAALAVHDPAPLLVLQPVTPAGAVDRAPPAERLFALQRRCLARLPRVRVIPQTHKVYGAR